jgi:hypothetical protein
MTNRLDRWRMGKGGAVLFYGYLVAIIVTAAVALAAISGTRDAVHRLDQQADRQCLAINGAVGYWKNERAIAYAAIADPQTLDGARARAQLRIVALNGVINKGTLIGCTP